MAHVVHVSAAHLQMAIEFAADLRQPDFLGFQFVQFLALQVGIWLRQIREMAEIAPQIGDLLGQFAYFGIFLTAAAHQTRQEGFFLALNLLPAQHDLGGEIEKIRFGITQRQGEHHILKVRLARQKQPPNALLPGVAQLQSSEFQQARLHAFQHLQCAFRLLEIHQGDRVIELYVQGIWVLGAEHLLTRRQHPLDRAVPPPRSALGRHIKPQGC